MFPSPPMLDAGCVRRARDQLAAHQPDAAAGSQPGDSGAGNPAAVEADGVTTAARLEPDCPLPAAGAAVHSLMHLSKVMLRPLRYRGINLSELHRPVDPGRVAAELCATAAEAVKASHGVCSFFLPECSQAGCRSPVLDPEHPALCRMFQDCGARLLPAECDQWDAVT